MAAGRTVRFPFRYPSSEARTPRSKRSVRGPANTGGRGRQRPTRTAGRHAARASEGRRLRAGWSTFAAHGWSLINDHRTPMGRSRDSFPGPFARPRASQGARGCAASRLRHGLRMDEGNVRARRREGGAACKPGTRHASATGCKGRPFLRDTGWPSDGSRGVAAASNGERGRSRPANVGQGGLCHVRTRAAPRPHAASILDVPKVARVGRSR
jgi:hypothetical protein